MKKILFPATARMHIARQQLLLSELKKDFKVDVAEYQSMSIGMANIAHDVEDYFLGVIEQGEYDLLLARADRFEILPIVMMAVYSEIPVAHIEGGDISGAVDQKVRYAISSLSDLHFPTNSEAKDRLEKMGLKNVYNFGSLDVEYAKSIKIESPKEDYILMCHHPMNDEDPQVIYDLIRKEWNGKVIVIKSNSDNGKPFGDVQVSPEKYISLIAGAECLVGNSSSFIKEASVFGTPVVLIGERQKGRLLTSNIDNVKYHDKEITKSLKRQIGNKYKVDETYYKPNTSKNIADTIKKLI